MDLFRRLRRFESRIAETVDAAAQRTSPATREPLEIVHAIVEAVEKRVEPAGRGKYVFPFNRLSICIAAGSRETQARFEAVLEAEPSLKDRIIQTLDAADCDPASLTVDIAYLDQPETGWMTPQFHIGFDRIAIPANAPPLQI